MRYNRAAWDRWVDEYAGRALRRWAASGPFGATVPGTCRRGWLAEAGRSVRLDNSGAQLANASLGEILLWSDRSEAWGEQDAMWVAGDLRVSAALATSAAIKMVG